METLTRLGAYYNVPISFFFQDDADGVSVAKRGTHLILHPEGGGSQFQLLSPDLNRRIEFLRITVDPRGTTHSHFNTHPGEEVHYVLEGSIDVEVAGRTYTLDEGDSIYFHSILPHRIRNPQARPAVLITAMSPPTRWARQMVEAHGGNPVRAPRTSRRGPRTNMGHTGRRSAKGAKRKSHT